MRRGEPTGFIGRVDELSSARALFDAGARLVTLVGPGGVGKTTFARRLGADLLERGAVDDVLFCDLSASRSVEGVLSVFSEALGLSLGGARDTSAAHAIVGEALAARGPLLVVADNFEQLQPFAAETVAAWRSLAPSARFLVTSRVPLDLDEERRLELPPLRTEEAIALFLSRAEEARPGFTLDAADDERLSKVLSRVDRLPLAIELAAARLEVLSLAELEARLDGSLQLLRRPGRPRGRHDALTAVLEGSWELLEPAEQAALARAAVFVGAFTLDVAERVLDVEGHGDALDLVHALKRKSLLVASTPRSERGPARLQLLETVRTFAQGKLEERGERRGWGGSGARSSAGTPRPA